MKAKAEQADKLSSDNENYKGEREKLEGQIQELQDKVSELEDKPPTGQIEYNSQVSEEDQRSVQKDFARQNKDYLVDVELSHLTPVQKKEFKEEWNLRTGILLKELQTTGDFVAKSDLKKIRDKALRVVQSNESEEVKKARLKAQADMLDKESGDVGGTSFVHKEASSQPSQEAYAKARNSLLVKNGERTLEYMAKQIQVSMDEGKY